MQTTAELTPGQILYNELHSGHVRNRAFMAIIGTHSESAYNAWISENNWQDVDVPDAIPIPSLGLAVDFDESGNGESFNYDRYTELLKQSGFDPQMYTKYKKLGLGTGMAAAHGVTIKPTNLLLGDPNYIHKTTLSLFTTQCLAQRPELKEQTKPGEYIITNLGEGDVDGYFQLHKARARCAKVIASFKPLFGSLFAAHPLETEGLTRGIDASPKDPRYERQFYNPLLATALEGMMSVGQSVNMSIQPGIVGAESMSVVEQSKAVLQAGMPQILSRLVLNADIGAQQMAGFAEYGVAVSDGTTVTLPFFLIKKLKARQREFREENRDLPEDLAKLMSQPRIASVSRGEGCPATRAVRVMSRMLYDALSAETAA
jgi:hypothetical protein